MSRIVLFNKTEDTILVEYSDSVLKILPREKQAAEIEKGTLIRIYKAKKSSRLCFGKCFSAESVRNIWRFGPVMMLYLDSFYRVKNENISIEITGRTMQSNLISIYDIILLNGNQADSYDYHVPSDKKKIGYFSALCLLPLALLSFVLLSGTIYGLIFEFSAESVFLFLLCLIPDLICFFLAKSVHKSIHIKENSSNVINDLKMVEILSDYGKIIKFSTKR